MQLIGSPTSPFVRKVRIVLAEKSIQHHFIIDSPWEATSGVPEHNPLGKIPVLLLDDGQALYDSRVIVEYLDGLDTQRICLLGLNSSDRIAIKLWEALGDGLCDAIVSLFLEQKRPVEQQSEAWKLRQLDKIDRTLAFLAEKIGEAAFCHAQVFSLADISVGVALAYLNLRVEGNPWQTKYPNLARYCQHLSARESFLLTQAPV